MEIIDIDMSMRQDKRFKLTMNNGNVYHFGLDTGSTYIDHHDKRKRDAYRKRHYANNREQLLIDNLTPSPALFSYYLLWGNHTTLKANMDILNKQLKNNI
jgi:hypothetical protein